MAKKTADKLKELIETADVLFRCNGKPVQEITELLGITRSELVRQMQTISLCGVPPYDPSSLIDAWIDDDCVYVSHPWGLFDRPVQLSRDEALSIFLAGKAAAGASSRPAELESAMEKIRTTLKPDLASDADEVSDKIDIAPDAGNILPVLNTLKKACGREKVDIEYYSAGRNEFSSRVIRPYSLIYHVETWYCAAHCEKRNDMRLFRLDRIKTADATGDTFETPSDFDAEDFRRNKMFRMIPRPHKATLRFAPVLADFAREKWPDRAKNKKEGTVEVTFRLDRLESFVPTILGYGDAVEVTEPLELRKMVEETINKIFSKYQ